jgi:2-polyprenyl-3-methyl-5-hydroxy-6-metoxy-1,4-benzoquinol methylase
MCHSAAEEIGHPNPRKLTAPASWTDIPNARAVKKRAYEKLFAVDGRGGDLVVEGSTLLYAEDRDIIDEIIGDHNKVFFLIDVPFEDWLDLWESRSQQPNLWGTVSPLPPTVATYRAYLEAKSLFQPPEHYWTVSHPREIHAFGYRPYQKDGFTDKKWEGLHMPPLKGKTLLDLACNSGMMCQQASREGATRVLGVDYNFRYLKEAHRAGVETMFMDLAHVSRIGEQFDYVLLLSTLHYIRDPERLIEEIATLTKELFVWEGPVSQKDGLVLEFREGPYNNYIPTEGLLRRWLENSFAQVTRVGPSVSPDSSTRVVYHCWKKGEE